MTGRPCVPPPPLPSPPLPPAHRASEQPIRLEDAENDGEVADVIEKLLRCRRRRRRSFKAPLESHWQSLKKTQRHLVVTF